MKRIIKTLILSLIIIPSCVQLDLPPISRTDYEIIGVSTYGYTDPGYKLRDYLKYDIEIDLTYTVRDIKNLSFNISLSKEEGLSNRILYLLYIVNGKGYYSVEIQDPSKPPPFYGSKKALNNSPATTSATPIAQTPKSLTKLLPGEQPLCR